MVLKKCHFDDLFKKVLEEIETQFDKDFELEIFYDLEGETDISILERLSFQRTCIGEAMWDILEDSSFQPELERFIRDNNRNLYVHKFYFPPHAIRIK